MCFICMSQRIVIYTCKFFRALSLYPIVLPLNATHSPDFQWKKPLIINIPLDIVYKFLSLSSYYFKNWLSLSGNIRYAVFNLFSIGKMPRKANYKIVVHIIVPWPQPSPVLLYIKLLASLLILTGSQNYH